MDPTSLQAHPAVPAEDPLVRRLRTAGCVFAEAEAAVLRESAGDPEELERWCRRRIGGEPLEHVVGWVAFGGLRLRVGPGAFVPRRRSLLLARASVAAVRGRPAPVVVEAYCGVAPVAASVEAAVPGARTHVVDADPAPLAYARQNLRPSAGVHCGPGLSPLPEELHGRVDVLAAVPPYVPTSAADLLPREAVDHEPAAALFGGSDGLDEVRALMAEAWTWLAPEGRLLVELSRHQAEDAVGRARAIGYAASRRHGRDGHTTVLELRRREG